MRIAIAHWRGRVSPVFDYAGAVMLVDVEGDSAHRRQDVVLAGHEPQARAGVLAGLHVNVLICGAVSWPVEASLIARGIDVRAHVRGDVGDVIAAFLRGQLGDDRFAMPGSRGWHTRFRHRHGWK